MARIFFFKKKWLTKDEVVWSENLTEWSRSDRVHSTRLQVDQNGPGYVFAPSSLVVVDVDALELEVRVAMVGPSWVDTVLVWDDFPKLYKNIHARAKTKLEKKAVYTGQRPNNGILADVGG